MSAALAVRSADFVSSSSAVRSFQRLLTRADLAAIPKSLPSGDVRWELDNGVLRTMSPPGFRHGRIGARFANALLRLGEEAGHGIAGDEMGVVLRTNPDRVVGPDVIFVCNKSLPVQLSPEGYLETIPELVVEIRSKNDTSAEVLAKIAEYLKAGVELVWDVDPESCTITAHMQSGPPRVFSRPDTLTAENVIPGFALPVAELMRD